jgi:hypothetical protein
MVGRICSPPVLVLLFCLGVPEVAQCGYMFTVGPFQAPTNLTIWFTDAMAGRLGDPVFDGLLELGLPVTRTTTSPFIFDHSVRVNPPAKKLSWNDVFFPGLALTDVTASSVSIPVLFSATDVANIFLVVNASEWIANSGSFSPGEIYTGFVNGRNPLLPGFLIGFSNDPNLTIEGAFSVNTLSGQVGFAGATPFGNAEGSLVASAAITLATPEPTSFSLLCGVAALAGLSRRYFR